MKAEFNYCKKEVKTQISYSANIFGLCEEEHAGGAIAFPSYDLGEDFHLKDRLPTNNMTFKDVVKLFGDIMDAFVWMLKERQHREHHTGYAGFTVPHRTRKVNSTIFTIAFVQ